MSQDRYLKDPLFRVNGFSYAMYNFRKLVKKKLNSRPLCSYSVYTWEIFSVLELEADIPPKHTYFGTVLIFPTNTNFLFH